MSTPNTYPAPIGVTVSFTNLLGGSTTPNFTLAEPGFYIVSLELPDVSTPGDQVTLQSSVSGVNTAVLTMTRSGYYNLSVPVGGQTYNFTTVNNCKNARVTRMA